MTEAKPKIQLKNYGKIVLKPKKEDDTTPIEVDNQIGDGQEIEKSKIQIKPKVVIETSGKDSVGGGIQPNHDSVGEKPKIQIKPKVVTGTTDNQNSNPRIINEEVISDDEEEKLVHRLSCVKCQTEFIYEKKGKRISTVNRLCPTCKFTKYSTKCKSITNTGNSCKNYSLLALDGEYCSKHLNDFFYQKHISEGRKPCSNVKSGRCLEAVDVDPDKYERCSHCRGLDNSTQRYHQKKEQSKDIIIDGIEYKFCGFCKETKLKEKFKYSQDKSKYSEKCDGCREKDQVHDRNRKERNKENGVHHRPENRVKSIRHDAKHKIELTDKEILELILQKCHYCKRGSDEIGPIGIDRIANDKDYQIDNVVPACFHPCNKMKGKLDYQKFISRCIHIATHLGFFHGSLSPELFHFKRKASMASVKNDAEKKARERKQSINEYFFRLTELEFQKIILDPCHYCGLQPSFREAGIDRVNNKIGYEYDNCVSCCSVCNFIKGDLDVADFFQGVTLIAKNFTKEKIKLKPKLITPEKKETVYQIKKANITENAFDIEKIKAKKIHKESRREIRDKIVELLEKHIGQKRPSYKALMEYSGATSESVVRDICLKR